MKKVLTTLMAIVALLTGFGCSNDVDMDLAPVSILVEVYNPAGVNLLDESTTDNILDQKISVLYNGKEYELEDMVNSRIQAGSMFGLIRRLDGQGKAYLSIGSFMPKLEYSSCTLILGDKSYELSFETKLKKHGWLKWRKFYIDGKRSKGDETTHTYVIVL